MADQDDFSFEEQDSDSEEWYEEEPQQKKKKSGSRSRLMLMLLLLIAIAGGAYYYFMVMPMDGGGPAAPPKAVVSVKKKPVSMPVRQPVSKPVPAPAEQGAATDDKAAQQPTPAVPNASAPVKMPAPAPQQAPSASPVPETVAEKAAPVPTEQPIAQKQVFEKPAEPKPAMTASVAGGAYTLTAGTYLLDSSVKSVSKKIRALGYEPAMTPVKRKVTMVRLKLGSYSHSEAAAKKTEIKSLAPGVFGIRKGETETVYVGSFLVLDKARRFADSLYAKGIKLTEEPVEVEKTLQRVTFGSFANADAASEAGRLAATKGVEATVFKNR